MKPEAPSVKQLRIVVHAPDFEQALAFYNGTLGLPIEEAFDSEGGAKVAILGAGRATLELSNTAQIDLIDEVEVGRRVSPHIRLAFEVDDTRTATALLAGAGAEVIAAPVQTPWNSLNSRLAAPGGLQLTLFQELDAPLA